MILVLNSVSSLYSRARQPVAIHALNNSPQSSDSPPNMGQKIPSGLVTMSRISPSEVTGYEKLEIPVVKNLWQGASGSMRQEDHADLRLDCNSFLRIASGQSE